MDDLASSVTQYCAEIGADPLLIQGAGGNVSWKDGATLWVKASGTWLADATTKNIFVPVDLDDLRNAIAAGNFSTKPKLMSESNLKPSIETVLHALMPHPVVVHLHAIAVLALLVRSGCDAELAALAGISPHVVVDYFKPGAELALAVKNALDDHSDTKLVFLKNHGLVVGGADVDDIRQTLQPVIDVLSTEKGISQLSVPTPSFDAHVLIDGYIPIGETELHQLALDTRLFTRLAADWALYPDHVVFLGPNAQVYDSHRAWKAASSRADKLPELVFVRDGGVFVTKTFSRAQTVQLRCFYDVLVRQTPDAVLAPLSADQVADLLNRDDEKYRIHLAKQ